MKKQRGEMNREDKRLAKGRRLFEYHCWENEDSGDAELWHHTHQFVTVIRKLKVGQEVDEEVGKMYQVEFSDGLNWDVFDDELLKDSTEFIRPDFL